MSFIIVFKGDQFSNILSEVWEKLAHNHSVELSLGLSLGLCPCQVCSFTNYLFSCSIIVGDSPRSVHATSIIPGVAMIFMYPSIDWICPLIPRTF